MISDNATLTERAGTGFDNYIKEYYKDGRFYKADFWDWAEIFEIIDDALEATSDEKYTKIIEETYNAFIADNGKTWENNPFNDDIMWAVIAMSRAYKLTGVKKYLDSAIENFKLTWDRAYSMDLGGGLWWRVENETKNACVNCPGAIAACLLGEILGDESYFEKAKDVIQWVVDNLYEEKGKVYDCYNIKGEKNPWSSTYNQGTFIGANMLLFAHYHDEVFRKRAEAAADFTVNQMYGGGIMNNEETGNDLIGFKGILSRWLYRYAKQNGKDEYIEWLRKNAQSAWENQNKKGLMWTTFADKTEDDRYYDVFGMSAAVAVMFNCI